jgi:ribosomal protein S18 acetylase RimI-like enzyme
MSIDDYPQVFALWSGTAGIGLSAADSRENIAKMLERNPGCSFVAERDGREIVGTLVCGHDGRRGCLYHLAVRPEYRRGGVGRALVDSCLARLKLAGIGRCHMQVYPDNAEGSAFWRRIGFYKRDDLHFYSKDT